MATAIAHDPALHATSSSTLGLSISLAQLRVVALAVSLVTAGLTRTAHLATYGFSEDEINKVHAVEEYRQGSFGANAEHPMLMKLAMWGSVALSERWNAVATRSGRYRWRPPSDCRTRSPVRRQRSCCSPWSNCCSVPRRRSPRQRCGRST